MDTPSEELRVEASWEAANFVHDRGGRLFVWVDESYLLHTTLRPPDEAIQFRRLLCKGFEFNLDTAIELEPPVWHLGYHRFPWRHVEAVHVRHRNGTPGFE